MNSYFGTGSWGGVGHQAGDDIAVARGAGGGGRGGEARGDDGQGQQPGPGAAGGAGTAAAGAAHGGPVGAPVPALPARTVISFEAAVVP